jgi:undecaprenyl diphosphate synthase
LTSLADPTMVESLIRSGHLRHIALIMDGNRRWASQKHLPALAGHRQGVECLKNLVRQAGELGLEALTVYAFSTENWQRGEEEVGYLMRLFLEALSAELKQLAKNNVRIRFIGDLTALPANLQQLIEKAHQQTESNTGLRFQIAANYGAKQEVLQAVRLLAQDVQEGRLQPSDITEESLQAHFYTIGLPDPDLLIRTGGESRLSNYLLWQCAYAEFYVTETLWPDFDSEAFLQAVEDFAQRQRRYGR